MILQVGDMDCVTPTHTCAMVDTSLDMNETTNTSYQDGVISSSLPSNTSSTSLSKWLYGSPVRSVGSVARRLSSMVSPARISRKGSTMGRNHHSESDPRPWDVDCWTVSTRSIRGLKHFESWNEDAFKVTHDLFGEGVAQRPTSLGKVGLFAVFDGHGGRACSNFAADVITLEVARSPAWGQLAVFDDSHGGSAYGDGDNDIYDYFADTDDEDGRDDADPMPTESPSIAETRRELLKSVMVQALEDGFRMTELAFEEREKELEGDSGSTALVALICSDWLVIANIGDSGAMYYNDGDIEDDGGPKIVHTKVHSYCNPAERARVEKAGGYFEKERLFGVLEPTRGFGDCDIRRAREGALISTPEVIVQRILPAIGNAFLVLGTDGLWGGMSPAKIIKAVQSGARRQRNRKHAAKEVQVAATITRGAISPEQRDDTTAVVVMIGCQGRS